MEATRLCGQFQEEILKMLMQTQVIMLGLDLSSTIFF
jgi:hypothetical protein